MKCSWIGLYAGILLTTTLLVGTPSIGAVPWISDFTIVTTEASGNQGNSWGGHQCRIVRTQDGVFLAYMVDGADEANRLWRLAHLVEGEWVVIAEEIAGKNPMHLLAGPDGTLHIISWPGEKPTVWSGKPADGTIEFGTTRLFGLHENSTPYGAAGINEEGVICVMSSGGNEIRGDFRWVYYNPEKGNWAFHSTINDYRYCYSYLFPLEGNGLAVVSNRDEPWTRLGYEPPEGTTFGYVFNAIRYWRTEDVDQELTEHGYLVEEPSEDYRSVQCYMGYHNAYLDTMDRMHIIYHVAGPSTEGSWQGRHAIFDSDGAMLYDAPLPEGARGYSDIFQDDQGWFYLLCGNGLVYFAGDDGTKYGPPVQIDLQGYPVEYSGFHLSTPRSGTPRSDIIDVAYCTLNGEGVAYFRLHLDGEDPAHVEATAQPQTAILHQNHPNPFNASTTIRYETTMAEEIELDIFNVVGQKVRTLARTHAAQGMHDVTWDGADDNGRPVESGMYFCRLRAGKHTSTRKLMYVK